MLRRYLGNLCRSQNWNEPNIKIVDVHFQLGDLNFVNHIWSSLINYVILHVNRVWSLFTVASQVEYLMKVFLRII